MPGSGVSNAGAGAPKEGRENSAAQQSTELIHPGSPSPPTTAPKDTPPVPLWQVLLQVLVRNA